MIHTARMRLDVLAHDISAASNATAGVIFTRQDGENHAAFALIAPAADATNASAKLGALKFQEADTTDATAFADITDAAAEGTTNSTATTSQFVLPEYNTTDKPFESWINVDLRARKKHIRVVYQAGNATDFAAGLTILAVASRRDVDSTDGDIRHSF